MVSVQGALFELGIVSFSPAVREALQNASLSETEMLRLHQNGEWESQPYLKAKNLEALKNDDWVCSSFDLPRGRTVWLFTEPNRTSTIALLENP